MICGFLVQIMIGKEKGCGQTKLKVLSRHLPDVTEENPWKYQSGWLAADIEPMTFQIRVNVVQSELQLLEF